MTTRSIIDEGIYFRNLLFKTSFNKIILHFNLFLSTIYKGQIKMVQIYSKKTHDSINFRETWLSFDPK